MLGKFGGPFRRTQHGVGPALHAGVRQEIGQDRRIEIERFEKSARRPVNSVAPLPVSRVAADNEADPAGNRHGGLVQIVDQWLEFVDHDRLSTAAQRNLRERRLLEIDVEQLIDAAEHMVPGRGAGGSRPLQDFLDPDPQPFLPAFEIFQHALAGPPRAALLATLGQVFVKLFVHARHAQAFHLQRVERLLETGRVLGRRLQAFAVDGTLLLARSNCWSIACLRSSLTASALSC